AETNGRPQGGLGAGAGGGSPQRSEGDLSMSNVLVFAEHLHGKFPKSTLVGVTAGQEIAKHAGGKCIAAVLGQGVDALGAELAEHGVDVVVVDGAPFAHYLADAHTAALAEIAKQKGCETIVATAPPVRNDLMPR